MPVRVYTEQEQERLNKMNAASDATQLGTTIAVLQQAANSGGGGGAYPEQVTFITSPGTTTLTLSQQGIIYQQNGIVQLPASAPDGTTFKIAGAPNDVRIDTNGAPVLGYGSGIFRPGRIPLVLKALNIPFLAWAVENKNTYPDWFADAAYGIGDRVQVSGVVYESKQDNNMNNAVTDASWWRVIT